MAEEIRADLSGLSALASCCEEQAATVRGTVPTGAESGGFAATTAAIVAVHADVIATAHLVADRLDSGSHRVTSASTAYGQTEASSAQTITAVSPQAPASATEV